MPRPISQTLPVLPLLGTVLLPGESLVVSGLDALSDHDLKKARSGTLRVCAVPLPEASPADAPLAGRLERLGVVAVVGRVRRLPAGALGAELRAETRVRVDAVSGREDRLKASVVAVPDEQPGRSLRFDALFRALKVAALRLAALASDDHDTPVGARVRPRIADVRRPLELPAKLLPLLTLSYDDRLALLAEPRVEMRFKLLMTHAAREERLQKVAHEIRHKARGDLREDERRAFLKEQMRVMRLELGDGLPADPAASEIEEMSDALAALALPPAAREAIDRELGRMALMMPGSPEYMVSHTYLSLVRELPWGDAGKPAIPSLTRARRHLSEKHFGLTPVKERILEYVAVMRHKGEARGDVLLLSGPPGVGKSTLAKQIAAALGRPFVAVSLGGVRDEAEIRGHRRTYIGSMPGKILGALRQAKSAAPVVLLDEIDKAGLDHGRGAVASALLEVLDYAQNHAFVDHYLGLPYDLSNVIFIATANSTEQVPAPLLDRMELVELPSYTEREKVAIAMRHLVPEAATTVGLPTFALDEATLSHLIHGYTREAGVRQLQRAVLQIARKLVLAAQSGRAVPAVTTASLAKLLGPMRYHPEPNDARLPPGVALGLAYTPVGGDILYIETTLSPSPDGRPRLSVTGHLGKVMKESAQAAWAYLTALAHARPELLAVDNAVLNGSHVHLHLPSGAVPKDGPSAGVAIVCALASLLTGRALAASVAMTGEISLRGQVLPIGGLREKLLAAHRYGKRRVLIPAANAAELVDIPKDVLRELEVVTVATLDDVLRATGLTLPVTTRRSGASSTPRRVGAARVYDLR